MSRGVDGEGCLLEEQKPRSRPRLIPGLVGHELSAAGRLGEGET